MFGSLIKLIEPFVAPISWTLIHSLWQGLAIAGLLSVMLILLRAAEARIKYALAVGAMATMLLCSITTITLLTTRGHSDIPLQSALASSETGSSPIVSNISSELIAESKSELYEALKPELFSLVNILNGVFYFWLIGIIGLSLYNSYGWSQTRQLITREINSVPDSWQMRFDKLIRTLGMNRKIKIIESKLVNSPCVIGWLKPLILVPSGVFTGLSPSFIEMILTHELAHIKRYDVFINYVQKFIEMIFFFNPAIWYISRKIRIEREHCCDQFVVDKLGNRLQYAKALAELEQFRRLNFGFAMAADGGSLLDRIRRIMGKPSGTSHKNGIGAALITAFLLLAIVGINTLSGNNSSEAKAQAISGIAFDDPPQDYNFKGNFDIAWYDDEVDLEIYFRQFGNIRKTVWYDELAGLTKTPKAAFTLTRDAGTFHFVGEFDKIGNEALGSGDCWFVASHDYYAKLKALGYEDFDLRDNPDYEYMQLQLALSNLSIEYAGQMKAMGYDNITLEQLFKMFNHGITPQYIAELDHFGYKDLPAKDILRMKDHGVDAYYIYLMKRYGYENLTPNEIVKARDHGVSAKFLESMKATGHDKLTLQELVKVKDHGVEPDYLEAMSEYGFDDLATEDLIALSNHGIDAEYIDELKNAGLENLDVESLKKMKNHGVDGDFIRALKKSGYKDFTNQEITRMHDHGVTGEFIDELSKSGYRDFSAEEIAKMRDYGVEPEFIKSLAKNGYDNLRGEEIAKMSAYGVDAEFIEEMEESGFQNLTPDELVKLRQYGVDGAYVNSIIDEGYNDLDPETIVKMRNFGVDASFINRANEDYSRKLPPEKLINLKNRGYYN